MCKETRTKRKNFIKCLRDSIFSMCFVVFLLYYLFHNGVFFPSEFAEKVQGVLKQDTTVRSKNVELKSAIAEQEQWYNNHFYQRMNLVEEYGRLQLVMKRRIMDDADRDRTVIKGKQKMLYYVIPRPVEVQEYVNAFSDLSKFAEQQGVFFAYVQAPYKHLRNSEVFPKQVGDYGVVLAEEFPEELRKQNIPVLDLNAVAVQEGKKEEEQFFKTDTHWTIPFSFWGYQKTAQFLQAQGLDLQNYDVTSKEENYRVKMWERCYIGSHGKRVGTCYYDFQDDFSVLLPAFETELEYTKFNRKGEKIKTRKGSFEDAFLFYGYLNGEDKFQDKYIVYMDWGASEDIIVNHKVKNGKKLLIIKDSFGMPVSGFLSLNFAETRMLDIRKENKPQSVKEYIEQYQPDVVLFLASPTSMYYSPEMFRMEE